LKLADVLQTIAAVSPRLSIPLVAMLSYSIVFRHGLQRFVAEAKAAGFAGLILPDVPPPEAQAVTDVIRAGGLDTILLVAPTTARPAAPRLPGCAVGSCITFRFPAPPQRDHLPDDLQRNVLEMRKLSSVPVCVGFGISTAQHVAQLVGVADGPSWVAPL